MTSTFDTDKGNGGETHQHVPEKGPHEAADHLTTNQGIRVTDNQNSLRSGERGPTLLEDFVLREKIFHFDHERIPERIVHARGSAAHGYFELYESLADITKADLFQRAGEKHHYSPDSPQSPAARVQLTPRVTLEDLPSNSTPRRETGISLAITFPYSSFRMQSSFRILFMR